LDNTYIDNYNDGLTFTQRLYKLNTITIG